MMRPKNLASKFRTTRVKLGLSQGEFGAMLGIHRVTVNNIERGRNKRVFYSTARKFEALRKKVEQGELQKKKFTAKNIAVSGRTF